MSLAPSSACRRLLLRSAASPFVGGGARFGRRSRPFATAGAPPRPSADADRGGSFVVGGTTRTHPPTTPGRAPLRATSPRVLSTSPLAAEESKAGSAANEANVAATAAAEESPRSQSEESGEVDGASRSSAAVGDDRRGLSPSELRAALLRPSPYDSSGDWRDWLRSEEYVDAWAPSSANGEGLGVEELDYAPLDTSTRYLLELLDDAAEGVRRGADRATTARCNRAIERLSDVSLGGKMLAGRARRADAILRRMERCERLHRRQSTGGGSGGDPLRHEPPLPDRHTYYGVLRLYATESGPREVAERAKAIAEEMVEKFGARSRAPVWNQVLSCWAVSTDREKCVHAASFLGMMKGGNENGGEEGEREEAALAVDSSSYGHVLRACALSGDDNMSRKLGAEVALRVWGDYKKSGLPITSHAVTFLLRATGNLPKGDHRGSRTIEDAFQRCRDQGTVNSHVLHELGKAAQSLSLSSEALGRMVGKEMAEAIENGATGISLLRKVPGKWTWNASVKTEWGW